MKKIIFAFWLILLLYQAACTSVSFSWSDGETIINGNKILDERSYGDYKGMYIFYNSILISENSICFYAEKGVYDKLVSIVGEMDTTGNIVWEKQIAELLPESVTFSEVANGCLLAGKKKSDRSAYTLYRINGAEQQVFPLEEQLKDRDISSIQHIAYIGNNKYFLLFSNSKYFRYTLLNFTSSQFYINGMYYFNEQPIQSNEASLLYVEELSSGYSLIYTYTKNNILYIRRSDVTDEKISTVWENSFNTINDTDIYCVKVNGEIYFTISDISNTGIYCYDYETGSKCWSMISNSSSHIDRPCKMITDETYLYLVGKRTYIEDQKEYGSVEKIDLTNKIYIYIVWTWDQTAHVYIMLLFIITGYICMVIKNLLSIRRIILITGTFLRMSRNAKAGFLRWI